ncbi:hypothetical protein F5X99DRAFT_432704 [Biscogniauxia marginata]|nr:hypothetical protein F5X99DRAFT_432704 [Biscogniauxia marginata]
MCLYILLTPLCAHSPTLLAGPSCARVLDQLARIHDYEQAWATPEARAALPFEWPDACLPRARARGSAASRRRRRRRRRTGRRVVGGGEGDGDGDGDREVIEGEVEEEGEEEEGNVWVVETGRWCGWECRNSYDAGGVVESAYASGWGEGYGEYDGGGGGNQGVEGVEGVPAGFEWGMGMPGATYGVERSGLEWRG